MCGNLEEANSLTDLKVRVVRTFEYISMVLQPCETDTRFRDIIRKFSGIVCNTPTTEDINTLVDHAKVISRLVRDDVNLAKIDVMNIFFNEFGRKKDKSEHGQVFTPDHIAGLMSKVVEVSASDRVLDPTCGSGSLLTKAMDIVCSKNSNLTPTNYCDSQIFGVEYDENIIILSYLNMLIHTDGGMPNLIRADSLTEHVGQ